MQRPKFIGVNRGIKKNEIPVFDMVIERAIEKVEDVIKKDKCYRIKDQEILFSLDDEDVKKEYPGLDLFDGEYSVLSILSGLMDFRIIKGEFNEDLTIDITEEIQFIQMYAKTKNHISINVNFWASEILNYNSYLIPDRYIPENCFPRVKKEKNN